MLSGVRIWTQDCIAHKSMVLTSLPDCLHQWIVPKILPFISLRRHEIRSVKMQPKAWDLAKPPQKACWKTGGFDDVDTGGFEVSSTEVTASWIVGRKKKTQFCFDVLGNSGMLGCSSNWNLGNPPGQSNYCPVPASWPPWTSTQTFGQQNKCYRSNLVTKDGVWSIISLEKWKPPPPPTSKGGQVSLAWLRESRAPIYLFLTQQYFQISWSQCTSILWNQVKYGSSINPAHLLNGPVWQEEPTVCFYKDGNKRHSLCLDLG